MLMAHTKSVTSDLLSPNVVEKKPEDKTIKKFFIVYADTKLN